MSFSRQELTSISHISDIPVFRSKAYNSGMKAVSTYQAKICFTSGGLLINKSKVLLIKHKKLKVWLSPGGHIEPGELPHQAAEREFWEETGIKVRAYSGLPHSIENTDITEYLPVPIYTNVHWISKDNYQRRLAQLPVKGKGCEQHIGFFYLVKAVGSLKYKQNIEETDGIGWFSLPEVAQLETYPEVRQELQLAFKRAPSSASLADALEV